MNGFYHFQTTQLPDSSGMMMNMSDSEFGSSDSSSLGISHSHPNLILNGGGDRNQYRMMGTTVQNQTYITQPNLGALSHYNSSGHHGPVKPMMRSPSGGKPAAMAQACMNMNESRNKQTDHFLSQFQAQMSQMKTQMDAVQNEIFFHSTTPTINTLSTVGIGSGKPRAAAVMGMTSFSPPPLQKRGPGRPRGSGTSQSATSVRYQSQISALGLKLKIKKSPRQLKRKGYKTKGRRKKRKGDDDEDEDENSEEEKDYRRPSAQKSTKMIHVTANNLGDDDESATRMSGWGDSLPENVLSKILSYAVKFEEGCIPVLVRASKVSRLWWKIASKPDLWTLVDLSSPKVKDKFKIERNLIYFLEHRFPRVKHLNLAGGWSSALTNLSIDVLIRCCKEVESIGLNGCQKLTAQHLKTITESCMSLKKLDLSAISTTYNTKTAVSPASISEAAETMGSRLMQISLANNCLANCPQIVGQLAEFCPSLQALDLSNVTSPRRDSIPINIEHLQQGCQKLKILRLTNSDFVLTETSLKEQVSSPGFPNLEELSIAVDPKRCVGMCDGDLERILKYANKLRLLDVRGCSRIGDSGLVRISAWVHKLEHLYLSGCYATKSSSDGLELVARKWRHSFKEIDFSWTPGEDTINSAMRALTEVDDDDVVPPLHILDLCGSSVSFDSVKIALKTCIHLERLNLTSCRSLPRGIKRNYQNPDEVTTLREQVLSGKYDDHTDD